MDVTPFIPEGRQVIDAYAPARFRIAGTLYETSVIVFPERTIAWPVTTASEVSADSLAPVMQIVPKVEVLLIGTGQRTELPPAGLRQALRAHGLGMELMDTGAACRTYNVLLAEARRVAAALIVLPAD